MLHTLALVSSLQEASSLAEGSQRMALTCSRGEVTMTKESSWTDRPNCRFMWDLQVQRIGNIVVVAV
jgi:hypothetical protein